MRESKGGKIRFLTAEDGIFHLGNFSQDGKQLGLWFGTSVQLPEIVLGKRKSDRLELRRLTDFHAALATQITLIKPQPAWVKSEDGTRVQVWCMKPANIKAGQKVPDVLQVHGGPHAQYGYGYFHEFQILAAQGYAVFFGNPRGSKGYGGAFCEAITGDWGNRDWMDIKAITRHMCHQDFVDPAKIGILGGSYGGFMVNWAISHTTAFAVAVTDRCVCNLLSLVGNSDYPNPSDSYFGGNPWDRPEELWRQSPIKYFAKVQTPTLIIHSEGDFRCNVEQAEQVFHALKVLGVPARFVRYPAETSHGMSRSGPPDLKIHRLSEILAWLDTWLKKK